MSAEPQAIGASMVDERHPWLGLDSFSEETRGFFFGRDTHERVLHSATVGGVWEQSTREP